MSKFAVLKAVSDCSILSLSSLRGQGMNNLRDLRYVLLNLDVEKWKFAMLKATSLTFLSPYLSSLPEQGMNNLRDSRYVNCLSLNQQNRQARVIQSAGAASRKKCVAYQCFGQCGLEKCSRPRTRRRLRDPVLDRTATVWVRIPTGACFVCYCSECAIAERGYASANISVSSSVE